MDDVASNETVRSFRRQHLNLSEPLLKAFEPLLRRAPMPLATFSTNDVHDMTLYSKGAQSN